MCRWTIYKSRICKTQIKPLARLPNKVGIMLKCTKRNPYQWFQKRSDCSGEKHVSDETKDTLLRNVSDEAKDRENWFAQYTSQEIVLIKISKWRSKKVGQLRNYVENKPDYWLNLKRKIKNQRKHTKEYVLFLTYFALIFCWHDARTTRSRWKSWWFIRGMRSVMLIMVQINILSSFFTLSKSKM